jgi:Ca-activated chloride channel family protein
VKLAALVATLALAAQADEPAPVVGGGSFNSAPILEPGRYRDTILPSEYLYYGFRVGAGQRLRITADTSLSEDELRELDIIFLAGNIHSPTRVLRSLDSGENNVLPNVDEAPIQLLSEEASPAEDTDTTGPWTGPGVYYFALTALYGLPDPPRAEIPIEFEAALEGTEQPVQTPTPTPTPTPSPSATAAPGDGDEEDSSAAPGVAAAFGVGGLLIGVIGGIALRRRRR